MTELSLNCGAATDIGLVRDRNEDRYWMDPPRGAFLVVDGVGGQAAGERAAEVAVAAIREAISAIEPPSAPRPPPEARVREAIAAANNRIFAESQQDPRVAGMACVLTLALVEGEQVTVGHVGDSRLYLIGPGAIRKVTNDHSPVGEMEDAGELSEEEAMAHPRRNEVFRDVGSSPRSADEEEFIEVRQCELPGTAAMLLCSDGLSDHLTSHRIREIAERYAGDAAQMAAQPRGSRQPGRRQGQHHRGLRRRTGVSRQRRRHTPAPRRDAHPPAPPRVERPCCVSELWTAARHAAVGGPAHSRINP